MVSGGLNTAVTYLLYLSLLPFLSYRISYTISYAVGIFFSYALNRTYVFRSHRGIFSVILLPMVYVVQYVLSIVLLWLLVIKAKVPAAVAPLVIVAITIPMTFWLTRIVFRTGADGKFGVKTL